MPLGPPPPIRLLAEWPRAAWSIGTLAVAGSRLRAAPCGDGRPVMILPGLANSDWSNGVMRRFLTDRGYRAFPWGLGRNLGPRAIGEDGERLIERIAAIHAETGNKVTLIGISLGGMMARFVASRRPDLVREVITVSAPFAGSPRDTNVWRAFEWLSGDRIDSARVRDWSAACAAPLDVPSTAIWSRSDGLVNGLACRAPGQPRARDIEVRSGHVGVQLRPAVLLTIADILADRPIQGESST
ncbi:triacylglycerol lipase [Sphingomonas sp. 28-63-12]|uniref:esterase/lipase family protein n=1 Tax=Sphingomonas sp. 28-63-12 TaxID=1970434 RepID=UPI000BD91CCE|nr:MAG: alpha/beta hydrolase [Sphingomonas sp. 28-63-12]